MWGLMESWSTPASPATSSHSKLRAGRSLLPSPFTSWVRLSRMRPPTTPRLPSYFAWRARVSWPGSQGAESYPQIQHPEHRRPRPGYFAHSSTCHLLQDGKIAGVPCLDDDAELAVNLPEYRLVIML